ncbi:MAG TPA: hypothetical protein VLZ81_03810 [Blastocatellia bacterium]|nr:hypothetical protein [Blastocatellia bacterium]
MAGFAPLVSGANGGISAAAVIGTWFSTTGADNSGSSAGVDPSSSPIYVNNARYSSISTFTDILF